MTRRAYALPLTLVLFGLWACADVTPAGTPVSPDGPRGGSGGSAGAGRGGAGSGGGAGRGSGGGGGAGAGTSGGAPAGGAGAGAPGGGGTSGSKDAGSPPSISDGPPGALQMQMLNSPCLSTPDPDVAAGPTLVGTAIQWNAYFFKKDTGALDHMYKWKALKGSLISDTHIYYDGTSKRWYLTTIVQLAGESTGVQIMVSSDETATSWAASVPITSPSLIDDPMPTITNDKVVITEHGPCVWVLDKATLQAGNAPVVQPATCKTKQNNQIYAVKYGLQVPSTGYGITAIDETTLNWISVDGTAAMNDVKVTEHPLKVARYDEVPVFGGLKQNGMDLESPGVKAMWDQNHLVWTKTIRCPAGMSDCTILRLYDVDTQANTIVNNDFIMPKTQLFNGAAGLDKQGNVWVLAGEATPTGSVGLALMGRSADGMIHAPSIIVPGGAALTGNRYGDYAAAAQDPIDGSLWMINEYAAASKSAGMNSEDSPAGCKVVHLTSP